MPWVSKFHCTKNFLFLCVIASTLFSFLFSSYGKFINRNDTSTSISTQLDSLIPASKIANLTQGMFVGAVSDNFDERIDQKIFHAQIVVDNAKVAAEAKAYQKIPEVLSFTDANGNDTTKEQVEANYRQIKLDVVEIIEREKERISNDPELRHLVEKEGE